LLVPPHQLGERLAAAVPHLFDKLEVCHPVLNVGHTVLPARLRARRRALFHHILGFPGQFSPIGFAAAGMLF
jgi:hypothetical protein